MRKPQILVVDAEPLMRWSVRTRLERLGYRVREAASPAIARGILRDDVDLTLLGVECPREPGCRLPPEFEGLRGCGPVIVMSSHVEPQTAAEARDRGVFEVVEKPLDFDALVELIESALAARLARGAS